VRSTQVRLCMEKREDLTIEYDGEKMTVPFQRLLHPLSLSQPIIRSKFGGQYTLYDFKWVPDTKVAQPKNEPHGNSKTFVEAARLF